MDEGVLPPTTPVNPYLGDRVRKNGPLFKSLGPILVISEICHFLGGLSLHLNHLIASRVANYDWPFGTLIFGLLAQIWTQGTLRHILGPILVILKYVNFWRFQGHLSTFQKMGGLRKSHFTQKRMAHTWIFRFGFRRRGP